MAIATFTNDQLCKAWQHAFLNEGTRKTVVISLMTQIGLDPLNEESYRKVYNNVTQRVKHLATHPTDPVKFPVLKAGKKGARRSPAEMKALQNIFDEKPEDDADTSVHYVAE